MLVSETESYPMVAPDTFLHVPEIFIHPLVPPKPAGTGILKDDVVEPLANEVSCAPIPTTKQPMAALPTSLETKFPAPEVQVVPLEVRIFPLVPGATT